SQTLERGQDSLGVADAERNVHHADRLEGGERRAGDEGAGAEIGDDALAGLEAVRRIRLAADLAPLLDVVLRQRDVERRAARAAGGVAARRLADLDRGVAAERRMLRLALPQLVLLGERQRAERVEAAYCLRRRKARRAQLVAIERRALEQPRDLAA